MAAIMNLPMIMGDRGRIEQVMLNVLGNAVKYTPDGGHIRVTAGTVGERVWMEVADDGIGIPKADRSRIFERFYRVDKARSRESGGTRKCTRSGAAPLPLHGFCTAGSPARRNLPR